MFERSLGGRCALIKTVQPPGYNGVQAGLLHEGVTAHVALPTPHQVPPLPLASRLHTQTDETTSSRLFMIPVHHTAAIPQSTGYSIQTTSFIANARSC